jgi:hypothetical protein
MQNQIRPGLTQIRQHRLECCQVAMDIGHNRDPHRNLSPYISPFFSDLARIHRFRLPSRMLSIKQAGQAATASFFRL